MKRERVIKASLLLWVFINFVVLVWSYFSKYNGNIAGSMFGKFLYYGEITPLENIFPFDITDYRAYDLTEFLLYAITPAFLFFLYKYIKNEI